MRVLRTFVKYVAYAMRFCWGVAFWMLVIGGPIGAWWCAWTWHDLEVVRARGAVELELQARELTHDRNKFNAGWHNCANASAFWARQIKKCVNIGVSGPKPRGESEKLERLKRER